MDPWRWYDISHRDHTICNPLAGATLDELIGLLDLPPRPRVLDVGAGKGELDLRLIERYAARVTAIDRSPYAVADLRRAAAGRVPPRSLEVLEMDAAEYAARPSAFDLTVCLGASWIFGGLAGTLEALARATRRGGLILVGEPYWRQDPAPDYLEWTGMHADEIGSHAANVATGVGLGLRPWLAFASSQADWDRYETLQWRAVERFLADHPDDADAAEIRLRLDRNREEYVRWGRDTLGWSIYLFARPR